MRASLTIVAAAGAPAPPALDAQAPVAAGKHGVTCETDNGGLTLPSGFCAVTVASNLGPVRQIVVDRDGRSLRRAQRQVR